MTSAAYRPESPLNRRMTRKLEYADLDAVDTSASDDARTIWRLADKARDEAAALRRRAGELESEAKRLDTLAAGIADGRPLTEILP